MYWLIVIGNVTKAQSCKGYKAAMLQGLQRRKGYKVYAFYNLL